MNLYNLNKDIHLQDTAAVKSSVCSDYPQFAICHDNYNPEEIDFLWLNDDFARDFCVNTKDACGEGR